MIDDTTLSPLLRSLSVRFTVNPYVFNEAVSFTVSMLYKPTQPILSGVLIEAISDKVTFTVFNYEVSAKMQITADVSKPGRVLVPGKLLANIAKKLSVKEVEVSFDEHDSDNQVEIRNGSAVFKLPAMPVAEYPEIPTLDTVSGEVVGQDFVNAILQVHAAASNDDVTPVLRGINFDIKDNIMTLSATDRYRIAITGINWQPLNGQPDVSFLVPAKVVSDVSKQFSHVEKIQFVIKNEDDKQVIGFIGDNKIITTKLISGIFPPVHKYFENIPLDHYAVVNTDDLRRTIDIVSAVIDGDSAIKFTFQENKITLNGQGGEASQATDEVFANLVGDEVTVGLTPKYLKDGLNGAKSEFIRISFFKSNTKRPGAILVTGQRSKDEHDEKSFKYLQQPILLMR
nr:DNA polymerase III subunit beta [Canibacter zhuwentaonis]